MALGTKRLPLITRLRSALEFNVLNESRLLTQTLFELLELPFRLFMVCLFAFKPRLQATFVRLQLSDLTLDRRSLIQGERKTLANYVRNRKLLKRVPGDIDQAHESSFANAAQISSLLCGIAFGNRFPPSDGRIDSRSLRTVRRPETGARDVGQNGVVRRRHLWGRVHILMTITSAQDVFAGVIKAGVLFHIIGPI